MPTIYDYLKNSNELPLHRAILAGENKEAIFIIDNYRIKKPVDMGALILKQCKVTREGVLFENIYGEVNKIPVNSVYLNITINNSLFSNQLVAVESLGDNILTIPMARVYKDICYTDNGMNGVIGSPISFHLNAEPNIRLYIDKDCNNIFLTNKQYQTALHLAVKEKCYDVVNLLVEKGLNINCQDAYGYTPLHYACINGDEIMIKYLVTHGANILARDAQGGLTLSENLQKKYYTDEVLNLLCYPNPFNAKNGENELHELLLNKKAENKLIQIKKLALNPNNFIKYKNKLPSQLTQNKILKKFLTFYENRQSCASRYQLLINKKRLEILSDKELDKEYILLLKDTIHVVSVFFTEESIFKTEYSLLRDSIVLLASICHCITYDLKKSSYDVFPWQNLEYLRTIILDEIQENNIVKENFLFKFIKDELSILKNHLETFIINENNWYKENFEDLPVKKDPELPMLFYLTEPIMILKSLEKIQFVLSCVKNLPVDSLQGRLALFRIIKLLGEYSKYSQQSRRLSFDIKNEFSGIPWQTMTQLRNIIAKNTIIPTVKNNLSALLNPQNEESKELFHDIKIELSAFEQQMNKFIENYRNWFLDNDLEKKFSNLDQSHELRVSIILIDEEKNELNLLLKNIISKSHLDLETEKKQLAKQLDILKNKPEEANILLKKQQCISNEKEKLKYCEQFKKIFNSSISITLAEKEALWEHINKKYKNKDYINKIMREREITSCDNLIDICQEIEKKLENEINKLSSKNPSTTNESEFQKMEISLNKKNTELEKCRSLKKVIIEIEELSLEEKFILVEDLKKTHKRKFQNSDEIQTYLDKECEKINENIFLLNQEIVYLTNNPNEADQTILLKRKIEEIEKENTQLNDDALFINNIDRDKKISLSELTKIVNLLPTNDKNNKNLREFWRNKLEENKKNILPSFLKMAEILEKPLETEVKKETNYLKEANEILAQLQLILFKDENFVSRINEDPALINQNTPEQERIGEAINTYHKNNEFRFAVEQLFADLYGTLKILGIKKDKLIRNIIEHDNDIYATGGRSINHALFFAIYFFIADIQKQLNALEKLEKPNEEINYTQLELNKIINIGFEEFVFHNKRKEFSVKTTNFQINFLNEEIEGNGWCAMIAAGIVNPEEKITQLINHLEDPKINQYIHDSIYNMFQASINSDELFDFNECVQEGKKIIEYLNMLYKENHAESEVSIYLKRLDVQKSFIRYILRTRYADTNIAAACLYRENKQLAVFIDYNAPNGQLANITSDKVDLLAENTVHIVLQPHINPFLSHYNRLNRQAIIPLVNGNHLEPTVINKIAKDNEAAKIPLELSQSGLSLFSSTPLRDDNGSSDPSFDTYTSQTFQQ
ncbi:MAG: hypothetical protein LEGION0398_MBIBDBAK_00770 [Legionellaceae bacterium]